MKILLGFILLFVLVSNSFGANLIFKSTKEIKTNEVTDFGTFSTSASPKIRIKIKGQGNYSIFVWGS